MPVGAINEVRSPIMRPVNAVNPGLPSRRQHGKGLSVAMGDSDLPTEHTSCLLQHVTGSLDQGEFLGNVVNAARSDADSPVSVDCLTGLLQVAGGYCVNQFGMDRCRARPNSLLHRYRSAPGPEAPRQHES